MSPTPDDSQIDEMRAALQGDLERARTRLAAQTAAEPAAAEGPTEVEAPATVEAPPAPLPEPSPGDGRGRLLRLLRPFR